MSTDVSKQYIEISFVAVPTIPTLFCNLLLQVAT